MTSDASALSPESIVTEYKSLVSFYATKYSRYGLSREDLEQEGNLGLLEAFKRYDSEQNSSFATYASFWIKKYILRALDLESKHTFKHYEFAEISKSEPPQQPYAKSSQKLNLPPSMPALEQQVLRLSFEQSKSLQEIAALLNFPYEKIRQTKAKALRRMRSCHPHLPLPADK
ncbi:MAG: sigma-70 family RNA polymerase sigma factor [Candidatus Cloacimonadaceae bacterium]